MADLLDLLDLDEAKRAVNLSESRVGQEQNLELAVTAVSRVVDDLRGPVVARTITGEVHDGGTAYLILRKQPVYAVTSVVEYNSTTPTTLAAEVFPGTTSSYDYWLDHRGVLHRRSGGAYSTFAGTRVVVTYQAGRYATTAAVDEQWKKAASEILAGNWSKFAAVWARGGDPFADPAFFDEVTNTLNRWVPLSDRVPLVNG